MDCVPKAFEGRLVEGFAEARMGGNDARDIFQYGPHLQRLGEGRRELGDVLTDRLNAEQPVIVGARHDPDESAIRASVH